MESISDLPRPIDAEATRVDEEGEGGEGERELGRDGEEARGEQQIDEVRER